MAELRCDPLSGRFVIVAPGRADRPHAFTRAATRQDDGPCPFCPGAESETPPEISALRPMESAANDPSWQVRVVPNKYPAFDVDGALETTPPLFMMGDAALGQHEVVIESPEHQFSLSELATPQIAAVAQAYRERLRAWRDEGRWRYAVVFKNAGAAAGASLDHAHSQIMALDYAPETVAREWASAQQWAARLGDCPYCALLAAERGGPRWVAENESFAALCPWAARFPLETWILPRRHASHYEALDDGQLAPLADMLRRVVHAIERLGGTAYNIALQTGPFDVVDWPHFHWRWEVFPRLTTPAGFEWTTNTFINPVAPEAAAQGLREMLENLP